MSLHVVELDESSEPVFWQHVLEDPLNYYFFIMDWKHEREDTRIFMALEEERIRGMMVVYKESIIQMRGHRDAVEVLLDTIDLPEIDMMAPIECEDLVLDRFEPRIKNEMMVMYVEKGDETIVKPHEPVELTPDDAEQISKLMRESYPDWWGKTTAENIRERMKKKLYLGFKIDAKVVSLGSAFFEEVGSVIGVVATEENHRNKGYATSVVSGLLEKIFQENERALIHVLVDNYPAIQTYRKVGFKPYRTYLLAKNATRIRT
jgi:ribosomal protein S18 acetylase RimI-like enzyme